jgi:hypothetical protein
MMVATVLMATAVVALAQLFGVATRNNVTARHATYATILAAQKIEELLAWSWADLGQSPATALRENTPGWVDYIDEFGRALGDRPHRNAAFARRWAVEPLSARPGEAVVIQVVVTPRPHRAARDEVAGGLPDEARLVTVRTRKAL